MLLGQAIGSVGDITFSRNNGKQIIKSKPSQVKNPQTEAQMIQRIILNTISQAYSRMSAICDHSFEGVPAGQQSMSIFMRRNLALLRYELAQIGDLDAAAPAFVPLGSNGVASNSYIISKGTLPEISPEVASGGVSIALAANTYQAVLDATGMKRGDQLTIITVSGDDLTKQKFDYSRIIIDPIDSEGQSADLTSAFIVDGAINLPNPRNENTGHVYSFADSEFLVAVAAAAVNEGCAIASRQREDGQWLRSNSALIMAEDASVGYSMQQCLDQWAAGGIDVESPRYLNNAIRRTARTSGTTPVVEPLQFRITGEGASPVTMVGVGFVGTTPVLLDAEGNKYFIQNANDEITAYGKYATNAQGATFGQMWGVDAIGDLPGYQTGDKIALLDYEGQVASSFTQVNWLVAQGWNMLGFVLEGA